MCMGDLGSVIVDKTTTDRVGLRAKISSSTLVLLWSYYKCCYCIL